MSSPEVTEKECSAELLDVVLTNAKEPAGIPLPETQSLSTVGLNPINDEVELRDEAQPAGAEVDGVREEAEKGADEVKIPEDIIDDATVQSKTPSLAQSFAPSLAPSMAPSMASIKSVTDAVTAAAIQCVLPTIGKEDIKVIEEKVETPAQDEVDEAKEIPPVQEASETSVDEAPAEDLTVPVARSSSAIKRSQSSKSHKSLVDGTHPLDDNSCSGQVSMTSHKSTASNKSIGGIIIEGHLVTVVPMHAETIEVNTTKLEEETKVPEKKNKMKKKVSFFIDNMMKKNQTKGSSKKRWKKKRSKRKQKKVQEKSLSAVEPVLDIEETAIECICTDDVSVNESISCVDTTESVEADTNESAEPEIASDKVEEAVEDVVEVKSREVEEAPKETTEEGEVVEKTLTLESEKPEVESSGAEGFVCYSPMAVWGDVNDWFNKSSGEAEIAADSTKPDDVAEVDQEEKKTEGEDAEVLEQVINNVSTEKADQEAADDQETKNDSADNVDPPAAEASDSKVFDCTSPSALWGQVNGWFQQPSTANKEEDGEVAGKVESNEESAEVNKESTTKVENTAAGTESIVKGFDCMSPSVMWCNGWTNPQEESAIVAFIEAIKERWMPADDAKPTLTKEKAEDIRQAVELLNAQRTIIEATEMAIKHEEEVIQESQSVEVFQAGEEGKARLKKELENAKRMEKAALELVQHLFNSLSALDRLEAIRISDDIAKAEEEVANADGDIDFGCFRMDMYMQNVKEEYGEIFEEENASVGSKFGAAGSIHHTNSNASSKALNKVPSKVTTDELPSSPSAISKTLSSKSSIKCEV